VFWKIFEIFKKKQKKMHFPLYMQDEYLYLVLQLTELPEITEVFLKKLSAFDCSSKKPN